MKLFIENCHSCENRIDLDLVAEDRHTIARDYGRTFTVHCSTCGETNSYSPSDIKAETSSSGAIGGGVVGGVLGLLGGPLGLILGGAIGAGIGNETDVNDKKISQRFNES